MFKPAANPYAHGIYSDGMIESDQAQGENINIYPEVPGPITRILVTEGQQVRKGDALVTIDDSVQRATAEQLQAQADAAQALLRELQGRAARRRLWPSPWPKWTTPARRSRTRATSWINSSAPIDIDPKSISADSLDNARNAERIAATNLKVIERQFDLTKAGAWVYDIQNAERNYTALLESLSVLLPRCSRSTPSAHPQTASCSR